MMAKIKNLIKGWKKPLKISSSSQSRESENLSERSSIAAKEDSRGTSSTWSPEGEGSAERTEGAYNKNK